MASAPFISSLPLPLSSLPPGELTGTKVRLRDALGKWQRGFIQYVAIRLKRSRMKLCVAGKILRLSAKPDSSDVWIGHSGQEYIVFARGDGFAFERKEEHQMKIVREQKINFSKDLYNYLRTHNARDITTPTTGVLDVECENMQAKFFTLLQSVWDTEISSGASEETAVKKINVVMDNVDEKLEAAVRPVVIPVDTPLDQVAIAPSMPPPPRMPPPELQSDLSAVIDLTEDDDDWSINELYDSDDDLQERQPVLESDDDDDEDA